MASPYKIIIKNGSNRIVDFYAFQKQAVFENSGAHLEVYSSCLATGPLAPLASSGAQLDFEFDAQNFVGAKCNVPSPSASRLSALIGRFRAKKTISETFAAQPIDLTTAPADTSEGNYSALTVTPLGLSAPTYEDGMKAGFFGVKIPSFSAVTFPGLRCGCASMNRDGSIVLSSAIAPLPSSQLSCAPVATFYVKEGSFRVGEVITYDINQAAECDFTPGYRVFNVEYNADGTFTSKGS
jgi:hypothetical protein